MTPDYDALMELAKECGFTCAAPLYTKNLRFLQEVRAMCEVNTCGRYGASWSCPPACGTLEELSGKALTDKEGIIVQTVGQLEDSFDWEGIQDSAARQRDNFMKMWDELEKQYPDLMPMGMGSCTLCEKCTYPDAPCRFPKRRTASMEACGLVVSEVCKSCGIPYNHGPNTIAYTGCFLLV